MHYLEVMNSTFIGERLSNKVSSRNVLFRPKIGKHEHNPKRPTKAYESKLNMVSPEIPFSVRCDIRLHFGLKCLHYWGSRFWWAGVKAAIYLNLSFRYLWDTETVIKESNIYWRIEVQNVDLIIVLVYYTGIYLLMNKTINIYMRITYNHNVYSYVSNV